MVHVGAGKAAFDRDATSGTAKVVFTLSRGAFVSVFLDERVLLRVVTTRNREIHLAVLAAARVEAQV